MQQRYTQSAIKAVDWMVAQQNSDGSYKGAPDDIGAYYKHPLALFLNGKGEEAHKLLDYMKKKIMLSSGDFGNSDGVKTGYKDLLSWGPYANTWIIISAHMMGRFDVSYPGWKYAQSFFNPVLGGFNTGAQFGCGDDSIDTMNTAHLGYLSLVMGDLEKALTAGNALIRILDLNALEADTEFSFYFRLSEVGLVKKSLGNTQPTPLRESTRISLKEADQNYFLLGYPIAFLAMLFRSTQRPEYLEASKDYVKVFEKCHSSSLSSHWSHKVGWGTAVLAEVTRDEKYAKISQHIADSLVSLQGSVGSWSESLGKIYEYDQTGEVAMHLRVIASNLSMFDLK